MKPVYGVEHTIANIERAMDGGVWPVLGAGRISTVRERGKGLLMSTECESACDAMRHQQTGVAPRSESVFTLLLMCPCFAETDQIT